MNSFIKDLFSLATSKLTIVISGLITSVVIARVLGPEENGVIASLTVYPALFMSFGSLGIRQSTTFLIGKGVFSEEEIKKTILQIWFLTSFLSLIICFFLLKYLSSSGDNNLLVILALIPIPFSLFNTYNSAIFLGKNNIKTFNKINWIPKVVLCFFVLLLVLWFQTGIQGYLIGLIAGPLLIFVILLYRDNLLGLLNFTLNIKLINKMLGLGLIYALALLINNLNYRIDIIFLDYLSSSYETGIYSKAVSLSEYLWQIPAVLYTLIFARSSISKNGRLFSEKIAQLLRLAFPIIFLCALSLYFLAEYLVIFLFGNEFFESILLFKILLPGALFFVVFGILNMDLAGKGKPWVSLIVMIPALLINVILNMIFIPDYGATAAAFASTISYSFAGVFFIFFYSKYVGLNVTEILKFKYSDYTVISKIFKKVK